MKLRKVVSCYSQWFCKGFTLIELLVAIMIIGILAAVAVPQYQKAVMKSRFAAMMPIAKTLANANEVYYAEHDEYSTDPAKLNVTPQAGTPDGTAINMYSNPEEVSFVRVENPGVPNARYVVYQKLSENFPETTWCEAGDTRTEELCVALGGTLPEGLTGNSSGDNTNYKAYLLTGQARSGDTFAETGTETEPETPTCPDNSVCDDDGNVTGCSTGYKLSGDTCVEIPPCQGKSCDDNGNITECASGLTLNNGECVACDIANAATCSTTSYTATSCNEGYVLNYAGACVDYAQLQARAASLCPANSTQYSCTIKNGTVYRCDKTKGKIDESTGECVSNGTNTGTYEGIYNEEGNLIGYYNCTSVNSGHCYQMLNKIPTGDGISKQSQRSCANYGAITKEGVCSNGYSGGSNATYDSHNNQTSYYFCSASGISTTTGKCSTYGDMTYYDNVRYNGPSLSRSYVIKRCATVSASSPAATCSNYQPISSTQYNEAGTAYKKVGCRNSTYWADLKPDGTCPNGYPDVKSYDSATGQYTTCGTTAASVNWETATCK